MVSNIVGQMSAPGEEYQKRVDLTDLLAKLEGNQALNTELRNIIEDPETLHKLQKELKLNNTRCAWQSTNFTTPQNIFLIQMFFRPRVFCVIR